MKFSLLFFFLKVSMKKFEKNKINNTLYLI
nr:MAG TPA: hypothetical protein [Caudoviricetes sp.]